MDTIMAPSYAIIFMAALEDRILRSCPSRPFVWQRYMDEVFFFFLNIWTHSEERLQEFISYLNQYHPTIQFTYERLQSYLTFLDVSACKDSSGSLQTDLYCKPTDTHQYLLPPSCHPPHICKNIPYSQVIRLRRICSSDTLFQRRSTKLANHLKNRKYKDKIVSAQISKAASVPREETLEYKEKDKLSRIPLVTTYHPHPPNLSNIVRKHLPIFHLSPKLQHAIPDPPVLAYRPKNLRDLLVSARLKPFASNDVKKTHTCTPCNKPCKVCDYVLDTTSFHSGITWQTFKIL